VGVGVGVASGSGITVGSRMISGVICG